jgi:hypothetical protein
LTWGGKRVGAGRKPSSGKVVNIDRKPRADVLPPSMQGGAPPQAATTSTPAPPSTTDLHEPPADLSDPRKAFWRDWAPKAIAAGTLNDATVLGFRELSEQYVIKESLAKAVDNGGAGYEDNVKLWLKATQRLDASMARFKLTAFGKPETKQKPASSAASAWGAVGAPAVKR